MELDNTTMFACHYCNIKIPAGLLTACFDGVFCQLCLTEQRKLVWEDCIKESKESHGYNVTSYVEDWDEIVRTAKEIQLDLKKYKNYKEYLESDEWKDSHYFLLERAKYKCVSCGGKATEVHHKSYRFIHTDLEDLDCVAICRGCHSKVHETGD